MADRNGPLDFDPSEKELSELVGLRAMYARNADQSVEAHRAAKGTGSGRSGPMDEYAREQRQKQTAVNREIRDRLLVVHESRSERAQRVDERREAEVPDDPDTWAAEPDRYDWPGIDLPE